MAAVYKFAIALVNEGLPIPTQLHLPTKTFLQLAAETGVDQPSEPPRYVMQFDYAVAFAPATSKAPTLQPKLVRVGLAFDLQLPGGLCTIREDTDMK